MFCIFAWLLSSVRLECKLIWFGKLICFHICMVRIKWQHVQEKMISSVLVYDAKLKPIFGKLEPCHYNFAKFKICHPDPHVIEIPMAYLKLCKSTMAWFQFTLFWMVYVNLHKLLLSHWPAIFHLFYSFIFCIFFLWSFSCCRCFFMLCTICIYQWDAFMRYN